MSYDRPRSDYYKDYYEEDPQQNERPYDSYNWDHYGSDRNSHLRTEERPRDSYSEPSSNTGSKYLPILAMVLMLIGIVILVMTLTGPLYKYESSDKYEYSDTDEFGDHWEHYEYTREMDLKYSQVDIKSNVKECYDPDNSTVCSKSGLKMTFRYDDPLMGLDKIGRVFQIDTILTILAIIFSIVIVILAPLSCFYHKVSPVVVGVLAIIEVVFLIVGIIYVAYGLPAGYKADLNDMSIECPSGASPCESFEGYRTDTRPTDTLHHYTMFKHDDRWGPENLWYMSFGAAGASVFSIIILFLSPRAPQRSKEQPSRPTRSTPVRNDRPAQRPYPSQREDYYPQESRSDASQQGREYEQYSLVRCSRCGTEHEYEYCPNCGEPWDSY